MGRVLLLEYRLWCGKDFEDFVDFNDVASKLKSSVLKRCSNLSLSLDMKGMKDK